MKIAVNTRFLIKDKLEGIGWFTYETLKRITKNHPECTFIFIFDRPYSQDFIFSDNIIPEVVFPPTRHPLLWYYWFEFAVPKVLKKYQPDLFLSTDGYLSLSVHIKTLLVIHDIAFEHYPMDIPYLARKYCLHFSKRYAEKADRIATVSEFSKQDLIQTYELARDKIDVVYNGADAIFRPLNAMEKSNVKKEYTKGADYFAYVGALHPRKNVLNLLKAYEKFKIKYASDVKLVIVGRQAWGNKEMFAYYNSMRYKSDVIFTGHLLTDKLHRVLGAALAMVYISYFEGFGIPLLEAMSCEVPVIAANASSLPEVAGDAALLVDPFSVEAIADAMKKIVEDKPLRKQLIDKGKKQKEKFSWDITSDKLWNSIEHLINE